MKAKKKEFRNLRWAFNNLLDNVAIAALPTVGVPEPEYQYAYGVGYVRLENGKPVAIVSARKLKAARRRKGK